MSLKNNKIAMLTKVNNNFIEQNVINIYTLAATIEKIEKRVYKKVS